MMVKGVTNVTKGYMNHTPKIRVRLQKKHYAMTHGLRTMLIKY